MKITKLEAFPLSIRYTRKEVSALIAREGVSDVIVKLTADNGLVGWGEACMNSETIGIQKAVEAAAPFVVGRDPWDSEAIARDFFIGGGWQFQPMTGNFAFAGIDMAMWDLMGKEAGQPIYRMFGGAQREVVRYFYYLHWGTPEDVAAQCDDGVQRGYDTYYFKVGVDTAREESLLEIIRDRIGKDRFLRVDANQAWTVPEAVKTIERWHRLLRSGFRRGAGTGRADRSDAGSQKPDHAADLRQRRTLEARRCDALDPQQGGKLPLLQPLLGRLPSPLFHACARRPSRGADRLQAYAWRVRPRCCRRPAHDAGVAQRRPWQPADRPDDGRRYPNRAHPHDGRPGWGRIEGPGLGVEVDEDKVAKYHEAFLRDGEFTPYGDRFSRAPMR